MHIFKTRLKVLLRTKSMIFWTFLFPIVLATFFNIAFSNIMSSEKFKPIEIGIINNDAYQKSSFKSVIDAISLENEQQVFKTKYYKDEDAASKSLKDNKIVGYYVVQNEISIVVKKNGIDQTIMKYVLDNYYQTSSVLTNVSSFTAGAFKSIVMDNLNNNTSYFESKKVNNLNMTVVYYYSLIGMVCLYGSFFGVNAVSENEANLSKKAARLVVAPTNKIKNLLLSLLASFVIQFAEVLILLVYLIFILKIDFGSKILYVILIAFVGSISGITMGTFIGVSNRKSENMKIGIVLSVTMLLSFLSGLMMQNIKYIIDNKVPIISQINPVAMITDGLYSLYYYDDLSRYVPDVCGLLIFSVVMIILSYLFIRRKKYDSI